MNCGFNGKVLAIFGLAAVLTGCAGTGPEAADAKAKFKGKGRGGGPVPVLTAVATLRDVPVEIQVVGNVEPYSTVSIRAQASGQLTNVLLRDGDYVRKGDPLFTIDSRQIDGQLAQAEANLARSTALLAQAEANLARDSAQEAYTRGLAERYAQLVQDGIFSKDQGQQTRANAEALAQALAADRAAIESAKAQIAADQAAIANLRLQKSFTQIVAPIDGRTGNVTQKLGNIVTANTTELAVIHQIEPIYVSFAVPENRLAEIKRYFDQGGRLPVIARAQDGSGTVEYGQLTFIDNAVDTSTGTIRLRGTFANQGHRLWPGQFVNVTLQLTTRRNAVTIPNQAVQTGQDGTFVYVVGDDNRVAFRPVKVGPRVDLDMVIEEGLQAGEVVVTEGQLRLQPGAQVQASGGGGRGRGSPPADGGGPGALPATGESKGRGFPGGEGLPGGDGGKGKGGLKGRGEFSGKGKRGTGDGA
jgi:multidrug efflux system membrane fusion protein